MRKAVWGENLKHGFVRGLGWNALAYSTEYKIPAQQQAGCVCVLNRFLTFETKEFDVVQKMEDLSMIRTQMRRPSELADWFEIIIDENWTSADDFQE
jgi:hypothetical protein